MLAGGGAQIYKLGSTLSSGRGGWRNDSRQSRRLFLSAAGLQADWVQGRERWAEVYTGGDGVTVSMTREVTGGRRGSCGDGLER